MPTITPEEIDALLPQTQCGLCGYGGCMPYAEAIVFEQAPFNLCPPGGVATLKSLGILLGEDPTPYIAEMEKQAKPNLLAIIREDECIGCTKCIQACPVDAIVGSSKQMHTIISSECTGCELCIPPCPVDCIEMLLIEEQPQQIKKDHARKRYQARQKRLVKEKETKDLSKKEPTLLKRKTYIQKAIARVKAKKMNNPY